MSDESAKKRNSSFLKNVKIYFREYCNSASIHGIRYFGEKRRTKYETIWWMLSVFSSFTFCFILINETYQKWDSSPIIVTFATTETPIWKIPFPAVTICPEAKSHPRTINFTKILYKIQDGDNVTEEESDQFEKMSLICHLRKDVNYKNEFEKDDLFEFYENAAQNIENFIKVGFNGVDYNYFEVLAPVLTDEGICYTFNMLDKEDIVSDIVDMSDYGYIYEENSSEPIKDEDLDHKDAYPRSAVSSGSFSAFEFILVTDEKITDYACKTGVQGFKVHIHHPSSLPVIRHDYFRIPRNHEVLAAVTPQMILTSEEIEDYSPHKRGCYIDSERKLRYFKIYTQTNCEIECRTNYTENVCGCVHFSMPHDNKTLICGAAKKRCLINADFSTRSTRNISSDCNCLPSCESLNYLVEISQSDWNWKKKFETERLINNFTIPFIATTSLSHVKIFFKTDYFIPSERHELYSRTDLVANFGGLLGLFTGFSLLSLVEIIYFLSIRIYSNVKRYGRKFWAGPPDNCV